MKVNEMVECLKELSIEELEELHFKVEAKIFFRKEVKSYGYDKKPND